MTNQSDVYVYELLTRTNTATESSVGAVALTVLHVRPSAKQYLWTVAVTQGQANRLRSRPWVISSRLRGQMYQNDETLEFCDPRGETPGRYPASRSRDDGDDRGSDRLVLELSDEAVVRTKIL